MKNRYSLIACLLIGMVLLVFRGINPHITGDRPLKVTEWDAFGYYMYLPSFFIYHDYKDLKWLDSIDRKYSVTGGNGWQASKESNGNYVFKYLGGVAFLQIPLFWAGHIAAGITGYPQDGFSPPYQYALGYGVILYCLIGIFILRRVLLAFFDDLTSAITLVLVCLATNFIQYAAVDNGQSHVYIFPLYALLLYATLKWHDKPGWGWAVLIGYLIGIAAMTRPTEALMLLIPILWNTQDKQTAKAKWAMMKAYRGEMLIAGAFCFIAVLPQLIYWKLSSGSFLYDVGSKWDFLNPHFRVLFGGEKGWFIYTPVTILFIAGMWFVRKFPFRKSVLWFCLLNIYVIIAWSVWRYGGSYSTRALVQSYPVFALPLAALVQKAIYAKWKYLFGIAIGYLLFLNLFQTIQYDKNILHYDDMNFAYYRHIYLNMHPSPLDMSLLDRDEYISNETEYKTIPIINSDSTFTVKFEANHEGEIYHTPITFTGSECWYKIECELRSPGCLWSSNLIAEARKGDSVKVAHVRLFQAMSKDTASNNFAFFMAVPAYFNNGLLTVKINSMNNFEGRVESRMVVMLVK